MMKHLIRTSLSTVLMLTPLLWMNAQPPEPPLGKRWVLNEKFSDEFNGNKLDTTKWYDYHPTWKGRPPGLFLPSTVKVGGGYMSITGGKMEKDTIIRRDTFNVKCGAVVSRTTDAGFGYYECRFRAAATTMSTTFWFSSRKRFPGPADCDDSYGQEWDVQECIGRKGEFKGKYCGSGMHSNSHFWYNDCDGNRFDHRATQVLFESDELASENFNTYGGWWKNEYEATYYYNNGEGKSHTFYTEIMDKPFAHTMGMNLVSETYPFPWISLPTDEELEDPEKNTCYYDWVRAYTLVDVDRAVESNESYQNRPMFGFSVRFTEKPEVVSSEGMFEFPVLYMSKIKAEISLELKNEKGEVVARSTYPALGGFGKKILVMETAGLKKSGSYAIESHISTGPPYGLPLGSDSFTFTLE